MLLLRTEVVWVEEAGTVEEADRAVEATVALVVELLVEGAVGNQQ